MNPTEEFARLYDAWQPDPTDSPNAIPFYRAYAALRALWGEDFYRTYESALHEAACNAGWAQDGERYSAAVRTLQGAVTRMKRPDEPRLAYSWRSEPCPPDNNAVESFVRAQYKLAYPKKRWGTKHAKAELERVREQAHALLMKDYRSAMEAYEAEQALIDERNKAARAAWLAEIQRQENFANAVEAITTECGARVEARAE